MNQKINYGWTGPYLVLKHILEADYSIQKGPEKSILNVHVDDVKPYEGQTPPNIWLWGQEHIAPQVGQDDVNDTQPNAQNENTNTRNVVEEGLDTIELETSQNISTSMGNDQNNGLESLETGVTSEPRSGHSKNRKKIPYIRSRNERPVNP